MILRSLVGDGVGREGERVEGEDVGREGEREWRGRMVGREREWRG